MILKYGSAITETIDEAMAKDPKVFMIGEDIGRYGGCFGISKGLLEKYGPDRIIDSPMSEQAIVGLGVGAALAGLKPIVEIMFMDFMTLAYDQLFNHASIFTYLSSGKSHVPLLIRVAAGAGNSYGATHSKTLIAPLMHIPGVKIVAPARARDVKGLLRSAIADKNPVVFVEHKLLYSTKEDIAPEDEPELIPLGKASIVKEGKDVVLISFSKMVLDCIAVAQKLEQEGISCEVIDLRTIKPLDMDLIKRSVDRIGKVVIVEEGYPECGVSSEISARIAESSFYSLQAPVKRINCLEVPFSCSSEQECQIIPSVEKIENAVRSILHE